MKYDHEMNDFGRINLNFEKKTSFLFHLNSVSRHKVKKRQDRLYIFIYICIGRSEDKCRFVLEFIRGIRSLAGRT